MKCKHDKNKKIKNIIIISKGYDIEKSNDSLIIRWDTFPKNQNEISIAEIIENNRDKYCKAYLKFIYDMGEIRIRKRTVKNRLEIEGNVSFWWMTLLAEKGPRSSNSIYTVCKFIAISEVLKNIQYQNIIIYSRDNNVRKTFSNWCKNKKINYEMHPRRRFGYCVSKKKLGRPLLALFSFLKSAGKFACRHRCKIFPASNKNALNIVTYFPFYDKELAKHGQFKSIYWGRLQEVLEENRKDINWIFVYVSNKNDNYRKASRAVNYFNKCYGKNQRFYLLEDFLDKCDLIEILILFCNNLLRSFKLINYNKLFAHKETGFIFKRMLKDDWLESMRGKTGIQRCVQVKCFDKMAKKLSTEKTCLYLAENQPWENALIWAWKKNTSSRIVGFQHVPLRLTNLRFYHDHRSYFEKNYPAPLPTLLAVNGTNAISVLRKIKYPQHLVTHVEALRHLYLTEMRKEIAQNANNASRNILVITSHSYEASKEQLNLLREVEKKNGLKDFDMVIVKPHPLCPVDKMINDLGFNISVKTDEKKLKLIFKNACIAYCSHATSGSVDAAYAGLMVIICKPKDGFNLSPVAEWENVKMVNNETQFIDALKTYEKVEIPNDYFYLDSELPRWSKLLHL